MLWQDGSNLSRSIWARQEWKHSERCGCLLLTPRLLNECVISEVHSRPLAVNGFYLSKKHEKTAVSFSTHLCLQVRGDSAMYNMLMRSAVSVYDAVRICEPRVTGGGRQRRAPNNTSVLGWRSAQEFYLTSFVRIKAFVFTAWMSHFSGESQGAMRWGAVAVASGSVNGSGNDLIRLKSVWGVE